MKYVTLLYMTAIAAYNLLGDNSVMYWRVHYFFVMNLTLTALFYELYRKSVLKTSRRIYLGGCIFSSLYTIFQIVTLTSDSWGKYLGMVNSELWAFVSASIVLFLIIISYDSNGERKAG